MSTIFCNTFASRINASLVALIDLNATIQDAVNLANYPVAFGFLRTAQVEQFNVETSKANSGPMPQMRLSFLFALNFAYCGHGGKAFYKI